MLRLILLALLGACGGNKYADADGDGVTSTEDCNDADAATYPGAEEVWYDGVDQDCDGSDDDQDADGYALSVDCDDEDPATYPGASDWEDDGIDSDCDGRDGTGSSSAMDADADGFAAEVDCDDADANVHPGAAEVWYDGTDQDCDGDDDDQDGDGYLLAEDCDDTNPGAYPDAGEVPLDGVDQDCDGEDATLESSADDADGDGVLAALDCDDEDATVHPGADEVWYDGTDQDCDGNDDDQDVDGYAEADDCDDMDPTVYPGAGEVTGDGVDQDCDGADESSGWVDADGDGVSATADCDDEDASVYPGASEVWYDGTDQDCDGNDDDQDEDGSVEAADCDDTDPTVYPGAGEVPGDAVDQDCDGADEALVDPDDVDEDGYAYDVDCDDHDASVHPGASEVWYDGTDQDCDGYDDDQDLDGYLEAEDCDDTDDTIFPGATEVLSDSKDQDCDGYDTKKLSGIASGNLVISEIMNNPDVSDDSYGEWFEIYNATSNPVDLEGLVVTATVSVQTFTVEGSLVIQPKGYLVFVRDSDTAVNGDVPYDYDYPSDFSLDNDAEELTISYSTTTFDEVAYDDTNFFPDDGGYAMSLDDSYIDATKNDQGQYWCDATSTYGDGDFGTPGSANDACSGMTDSDGDGWVSAHDCNDSKSSTYPGATETARDGTDSDCDDADGLSTSLRSGEFLITEIMQNPDIVSDSEGEWFEIYNTTSYSWNLAGLTVRDSAGTETFTVEDDLIVTSKTYVIFAVESDDTLNGGVTGVDYDYPGSSFGLGNGSDDIYLYNGTTLVDGVAWDNGDTFPDPTGASMSLRSTGFDVTRNNTGSYWCTSTSRIGGVTGNDRGTPGATNDGC